MIQVAAALIENKDGKLLIARRAQGKSQAGLWEFPGGKLEEGESPEACLVRELLEEMNIVIAPSAYFGTNDYDYGSVQIRLHAYRAVYLSGEINLQDHDEFRWVDIEELPDFEFAPADIKFIEALLSRHEI